MDTGVDGDVLNENFRDSVSTIDKEGKRVWIYAKKPSGKLYNARTLSSLIYLALFFTIPFIKLNGNPLFQFDVIHRKFILFNVVFWPQDFFLFGLGMLIFFIFIAVFTMTFGRVFCGWACPQTIFMEMIFRRIEYWIEGDSTKQIALNKRAWDIEKVVLKTLKHGVFIFIAFIVAHFLLAYIIGMDQLILLLKEPISVHKGGFIALLAFTGVFYFVFAWFREQACLVVCPYGRMQGVLLDKNSIVVAYDHKRGEPRHKFKKNETRSQGDCIDCNQCVKVCPTGIDIRNGTQLECTNCTACIDACDHMMEGVNMPKGLIRYASENNIENKEKLRITTRMVVYSAVLLVLIGIEIFLLASRSDLDTTIIRARGMLYQEQPNNQISNIYNIKLVNKTYNDLPVELKPENFKGEIKMVGKNIFVPGESLGSGEFFIFLDKNQITQRKTKLKIGVYSNNEKIKTVETTFLGPVKKKQ